MHTNLASRESWSGEFINKTKSAAIYPERISITLVRDRHGKPSHYVAAVSHIDNLRNDVLTDLPSRHVLTDSPAPGNENQAANKRLIRRCSCQPPA